MSQKAFGLTSLYDPSIAVDQSALERQMALAAALRKSALTPVETAGRQVGGVGYKVSPWEGVAKALQAYQANKLDSDTDASRLALGQKQSAAMGPMLAGMLGDGGVGTSGTQPPAPVSEAGQVPPEAAAPQAESQGAKLKRAAMSAMLMGNTDLANKLIGNMLEQTPEQKNMAALGQDPAEMGRLRTAAAKKDALMPLTPGQPVFDPSTNKEAFRAPENLSPEVRQLGETLKAAGIDPASPQGQAIFSQLAGKQVTHQPAANVNVKTGSSLAEQVGPIMKDSQAKAEGAVAQIDAAQRVIAAANNPVFAGPGADPRLKLSQLSQMIGIGGKDEAAKIESTRTVVRGFAELTLQGRKQMRGQGQITEQEGLLAERAMSGKIEDLTIPEIKQLATASQRAAQFQLKVHNQKLDAMKRDPEIAKLVPFYEAPSMGNESPGPGGGGVRKVDW